MSDITICAQCKNMFHPSGSLSCNYPHPVCTVSRYEDHFDVVWGTTTKGGMRPCAETNNGNCKDFILRMEYSVAEDGI